MIRVNIVDMAALSAVSPSALSAFARSRGWEKTGEYGDHSDVYTAAALPEILLPRTQHLADYPIVVSRLITIFADASATDPLAVYGCLIAAGSPPGESYHGCWNCFGSAGPMLAVWCPDGPEFATVCLECWTWMSEDEDRYGQQRIIGVVA